MSDYRGVTVAFISIHNLVQDRSRILLQLISTQYSLSDARSLHGLCCRHLCVISSIAGKRHSFSSHTYKSVKHADNVLQYTCTHVCRVQTAIFRLI